MLHAYNGAGIALFCEGMALMGKRRYKPFAGKWSFPGGKKEQDETFHECALREFREEIGIDLTKIDVKLLDTVKINTLFFHWQTFIYEIDPETEAATMPQFPDICSRRTPNKSTLKKYYDEFTEILWLIPRQMEGYYRMHPGVQKVDKHYRKIDKKRDTSKNTPFLKRWWYNRSCFFKFDFKICTNAINLSIDFMGYAYATGIDFQGGRRNFFWFRKDINQYKSFIASLSLDEDFLTGIGISFTMHTDHSGCLFYISILGLMLYLEIGDCRHWDRDNNKWEPLPEEET